MWPRKLSGLRLNKLKEIWMGQDRTREIYRALVYELLNWRDAQRELKALIKARYRQWGVLQLQGLKVFSTKWRKGYLAQLPGEEERRMILRLHSQHDHAIAQWKDTLGSPPPRGQLFEKCASSSVSREWVQLRPMSLARSLKPRSALPTNTSSGNTASSRSPIARAITNP